MASTTAVTTMKTGVTPASKITYKGKWRMLIVAIFKWGILTI